MKTKFHDKNHWCDFNCEHCVVVVLVPLDCSGTLHSTCYIDLFTHITDVEVSIKHTVQVRKHISKCKIKSINENRMFSY